MPPIAEGMLPCAPAVMVDALGAVVVAEMPEVKL